MSRPEGPLAPADTIVVTGGLASTAVEADAVRSAAARLAAAADDLREAVTWCSRAGCAVGQPLGAAWAAPGLAVQQAAAVEAVERAARRLQVRADLYDLLGWRLLRAAGLYEEAESVAERAVGALVTTEGFVLGRVFAGSPAMLLGGAAAAAGTGVLAWLSNRATGGLSTALFHAVAPEAVRRLAPWTDEGVAGLGAGIAWARPAQAGGEVGVPGGARVVAAAVRHLPSGAGGDPVVVTQVQEAGFAGGAAPAWSTQGGTVAETLRRVADLYPWDGGAPYATVAVQRVVGADGGVSWTVLVPGTESVLPAGHPWDAVTDLELMGREADGASAAVVGALEQAGVGADEPVTLVGHSLGGIAAMALASSPGFTERYRLGGVVTAGSPVATFGAPPGVPVLHLETAEEVVSAADGHSSGENPRTGDRVTVSRSLAASADPLDRAASGSVPAAHGVDTHVRTLELAVASGDPRVLDVTDRVGPLLQGEQVTTTYWSARRVTP
ncbi:hypothetical protein L1785_04830 [Antribacter sp. KLBMP9083]|uniref:PGAP1-like protein n=1 Tax=Antribacter soli TaxID=2910976 RepID=A0AA41UAN4_9MICO|nr:hypothetical protein [Antribacter soli]MCF4120299.1 hypothetical protein [Antribacter soli]